MFRTKKLHTVETAITSERARAEIARSDTRPDENGYELLVESQTGRRWRGPRAERPRHMANWNFVLCANPVLRKDNMSGLMVTGGDLTLKAFRQSGLPGSILRKSPVVTSPPRISFRCLEIWTRARRSRIHTIRHGIMLLKEMREAIYQIPEAERSAAGKSRQCECRAISWNYKTAA